MANPYRSWTLKALLAIGIAWWPVSGYTEDAASSLLQQQTEALTIIENFAKKICDEKNFALEGNKESLQLSGSAKAELNTVVKMIADAGVEGAAKYKTGTWEGVLQKDVANVLVVTANCKKEVFLELKDSLIPTSPRTPARPGDAGGAQSPDASKRYVADSDSTETPGVIIRHPDSWYVSSGPDGDRLLPKADTIEDKVGAEISIFIGTIDRQTVETDGGAALRTDSGESDFSPANHFNFVRKMTEQLATGQSASFQWRGQRQVEVPVVNNATTSPEKAADSVWIVDFVKDGEYTRGFRYLQPPAGLYDNTFDSVGLVEIDCTAPEPSFKLLSASCDTILGTVSIISHNYWDD